MPTMLTAAPTIVATVPAPRRYESQAARQGTWDARGRFGCRRAGVSVASGALCPTATAWRTRRSVWRMRACCPVL